MTAHKNNFGVIRLVLACLVIAGHSTEMIYGDRSHDVVFRSFGAMSVGIVAVDAFFVISGFLIAQSMLNAHSAVHFLERRLLRIYPAFIVAFLLCVFYLGPLVGAAVWSDYPKTMLRMLMLKSPDAYPGQFPGVEHYPVLNGSMWTIGYEFRCYMLVLVLGVLGLLQKRRVVLFLTAFALLAAVAVTFAAPRAAVNEINQHRLIIIAFGDLLKLVSLSAPFLVGMSFLVYCDVLEARLSGFWAIGCAGACCVLMTISPHTAEMALTTLGAVPLFWLALKANIGRAQRINDSWDISYGVYLYGWPIAAYLRWLTPEISPGALTLATLPLAIAAGTASWWLVERGTKDLHRRWRSKPPLAAQTPSTV